MLIDWGIEQDIDELREYDIWAILIGRHLIKVELNSSPLGRKPYYTASFERNQDMIWGRGIPQKMEGAQHAANAARRALINNLAISSGPQVTVNTKLLPPGAQVTKIYPWKIWQYKGDGSGAAPFNFFQPQSNASELMEAIERFASEADEDTGIPRYTHGEDKDYYQGAAGTARGLAMLMNAAGKAVKQVIANIDEGVIRPLITALYNYNMLDPSCDPSCKGDLQVKARGAIALSVKEQIQIQRNEFLQLVLNSEIIQQIIGPEGITALLKESVRTLDMPVNSIIPATSPVPSVAPAEVSAEPEAEVIEGTSKAV
jgi:hypothetical protein